MKKENDIETTRTHWELGKVLEDETSETIETFNLLSSALSALIECEDESAFIDLWTCEENYQRPICLDQTFKKKDVLAIINGEFVSEE